MSKERESPADPTVTSEVQNATYRIIMLSSFAPSNRINSLGRPRYLLLDMKRNVLSDRHDKKGIQSKTARHNQSLMGTLTYLPRHEGDTVKARIGCYSRDTGSILRGYTDKTARSFKRAESI